MSITREQLEHVIAVTNFKIMLGTVALYKRILAERRKLEREYYANRTPELEQAICLCVDKLHLLRTHERFHGFTIAKFIARLPA